MRILAIGALVVLTGCPMSNKAVADSVGRQLSLTTIRVAQLEAEVTTAEQRVQQMEDAMRAQGAQEVTRLETIEEVNAEVGRIRGDIEVLQYEVADLKKTVDEMIVDGDARMLYLESRVAQLEGFLGVEPPPPPIRPVTPEPGVEPEPTTVVDPETGEPIAEEAIPETLDGKLEKAMEHMEAGRNAVARAILLKAQVAHPGEAKLDEVQYRIAETWFNEGDWRRAISEFNTVIESWPTGVWAPWAMLAQGDAFKEWGQTDNARLFYEEVVRVYPKSEAAKEAKKLLAP